MNCHGLLPWYHVAKLEIVHNVPGRRRGDHLVCQELPSCIVYTRRDYMLNFVRLLFSLLGV